MDNDLLFHHPHYADEASTWLLSTLIYESSQYLCAYFQCIFYSVRFTTTFDNFAIDTKAQYIVRDFVIVRDWSWFWMERGNVLLLIIIHFEHFFLNFDDSLFSCTFIDTRFYYFLSFLDGRHDFLGTTWTHINERLLKFKDRICQRRKKSLSGILQSCCWLAEQWEHPHKTSWKRNEQQIPLDIRKSTKHYLNPF